MESSIRLYNNAQEKTFAVICNELARLIDAGLPKAESKVWHGGPVWFLEGNPVVGYWVRKTGVQLLFWSGQSFEESGLLPEGKFKAAHAHYTSAESIRPTVVARWLRKAKKIQWDYKNIAKRRGVLEKIGAW